MNPQSPSQADAAEAAIDPEGPLQSVAFVPRILPGKTEMIVQRCGNAGPENASRRRARPEDLGRSN